VQHAVARRVEIEPVLRRRLTADDAFEYAPKISPDGRRVLVGRRSGGGADLGYWLVPISIIGGPERRVLPAGAPPLGSAALTGDGSIGGDGLSTWAGRAAFDPGGRWLLLVTGGGSVVLADLGEAGGRTTPTATALGLVAEGAPVWLTNEGRFALVARATGRQDPTVWTVEPSGNVDLGVAAVGSLDAAPDGLVVVLIRPGSGSTARLATIRIGERGTARPLTEGSSFDDRWPVFSPDGGTILFSRVASGPYPHSTGIWTIGRAGGEPAQLATDGAEPRWLP